MPPLSLTDKHYLKDSGEESSTDKLCAEVFPEFQFADSGAETLKAVRLAVSVCGLIDQCGADWFWSNVHLTPVGDLIYNKEDARMIKPTIKTDNTQVDQEHPTPISYCKNACLCYEMHRHAFHNIDI